MNQIASRSQLRMSYLRWTLFTVPLVLLLGIAFGRMSGSGYLNRWFAALEKPDLMPAAWVFGVVWPLLYLLLGLALAMLLHARGARFRGGAVALFLLLLALLFSWSPIFFAAHQITAALYLIIAIFGLGIVTSLIVLRVRPAAAALMVPFLLWVAFATYLNYEIWRLNPEAERLVAPAVHTQI